MTEEAQQAQQGQRTDSANTVEAGAVLTDAMYWYAYEAGAIRNFVADTVVREIADHAPSPEISARAELARVIRDEVERSRRLLAFVSYDPAEYGLPELPSHVQTVIELAGDALSDLATAARPMSPKVLDHGEVTLMHALTCHELYCTALALLRTGLHHFPEFAQPFVAEVVNPEELKGHSFAYRDASAALARAGVRTTHLHCAGKEG